MGVREQSLRASRGTRDPPPAPPRRTGFHPQVSSWPTKAEPGVSLIASWPTCRTLILGAEPLGLHLSRGSLAPSLGHGLEPSKDKAYS